MRPPGVAKPFDPKTVAYVLGGAALAILIGIFTKSWMSGRDGFGGVGPLGIEVCFGSSVCQSVGWQGSPGSYQLFGYLALLGGLAAAGVASWMAFLVLTSTPARWPQFKTLSGVLAGAVAAMAVFAIRLLVGDQHLSVSWSPVFAIGGAIVAWVFIRKLRPYWPGLGNLAWPVIPRAPQHANPYGPPPSGPAPSGLPPVGYGQPYVAPQPPYVAPQPVAAPGAQFCPRCGKPLEYVAQYQRWFCRGCNQYA